MRKFCVSLINYPAVVLEPNLQRHNAIPLLATRHEVGLVTAKSGNSSDKVRCNLSSAHSTILQNTRRYHTFEVTPKIAPRYSLMVTNFELLRIWAWILSFYDSIQRTERYRSMRSAFNQLDVEERNAQVRLMDRASKDAQ
jgi:hypothetical protein